MSGTTVETNYEKEMDLRIHAEQVASTLLREEEAHVADHDQQLEKFLSIHDGLSSCDAGLEIVERTLLSYQTDLTKVSGEIRHINDMSAALGIKLENRRSLETSLHRVIERILLEPETIDILVTHDINDLFLESLAKLDKQATFSRKPQAKSLASYKDVVVELDRLVLAICGRIKKFFLEKIRGFRAFNTNVQIIQNSVLIHFQPAYTFLVKWHVDAGDEIQQEYMHTMRWFYDDHFDRYQRGLTRFQAPMPDKAELMVDEGIAPKASFFGTAQPKTPTTTLPIYTLADRMKPLINQSDDVIILHIAESTHQTYSFEQLFRSFNVTLMDNISSEFYFVERFFSTSSADDRKHIFANIFNGTFQAALNALRKSIDTNYDALGLLLCIRVNGAIIGEMQRRKISTMEDYTHATSMLLWPQFQSLMDRHIESVRKGNPKRLPPPNESQTHPLMLRYASFASALLQLNSGHNDGNVATSVARLRNAVVVLMEAIAKALDPQANLIFLINNAHNTMEALSKHQRYAESEVEFFRGLFNTKVNFYVEQQLKDQFSILVTFLRTQSTSSPKEVSSAELDRVSGDFNAAWRQRIAFVSSSAMKHFANFKIGQIVLQSLLSSLLLQYSKLTAIIERQGRQVLREMAHPPISEQTLILEMKKFRGSF